MGRRENILAGWSLSWWKVTLCPFEAIHPCFKRWNLIQCIILKICCSAAVKFLSFFGMSFGFMWFSLEKSLTSFLSRKQRGPVSLYFFDVFSVHDMWHIFRVYCICLHSNSLINFRAVKLLVTCRIRLIRNVNDRFYTLQSLPFNFLPDMIRLSLRTRWVCVSPLAGGSCWTLYVLQSFCNSLSFFILIKARFSIFF